MKTSQRVRALVLIPVISVFIFLAIYPLQPPAVVPASSPPTEFSAERAVAHLVHVARAPHPTGSAENGRVRAYIVGQMAALGLATEVQSTAVLRVAPRFASGATVNNVIGRFPGSRNTRAVMLVAHYDSVPTGPGASDDGSGIATILETMRALKAGPPLQNDVILLATDGEELGLLGAQAFMAEHTLAKDVGVVLNFEARGTSGASMLFETSSGNEWLLGQLAAAAPQPVGSSYMYEFYKRMPNDTDFSVFRRGGLAGLNFAYGGNWTHYHTAEDNLQSLDRRSLQHDGSYALALARRFGDSDLTKPSDGDAVYFTLFGRTVVYAQKWAVPLMIAVVFLFIGVLILGLKRGRLTLRGMAMGFFGWLIGLVGAGLLSVFAWGALQDSSLVNPLPYGVGYNSGLYASGFLALTVAVAAAVYALVHGRAGHESLTAGALLWWLVPLILASLRFPGASYLFLWPLAASLLVFCHCLTRKDGVSEWKRTLLWTLPAFVAFMFFLPLPYDLLTILSTSGLVPLAAAVALLVGFLYPQLHVFTEWRKWLIAGAAAIVALGFFAAAVRGRGYDAEHPRADTILYWIDADAGKAEWISADAKPDEWTSQFLGQNPSRGNLRELLPFNIPIIRSPAAVAMVEEPRVAVLDASTENEVKNLQLLIIPPRRARALWFEARGAKVLAATISGKKVSGLPRESGVQMYYVGIPDGGLAVELSVPAGANPELQVVAQCDGLPSVAGASYRPRPETVMPSPRLSFNSCTLIAKTFRSLDARETTQPPR
jgi:hypothetical protein